MSLEKVIEEGFAAVVAAINANTELAAKLETSIKAAAPTPEPEAAPAPEPAPKKVAKAKAKAKAPDPEPEPEPEAEIVTAEVVTPTATVQTITEYVKARFVNNTDSGPLKEVFSDLREKYGVAKVGDLPADKLDEFYAEVVELLPESDDNIQ